MMAARSYQQHGPHAMKRQLKVRGLDGIDKRSSAARALLAWRPELETNLGGPEALTAQQRAVVDVASTTKLLLDSVDRWLLEQGDSLVAPAAFAGRQGKGARVNGRCPTLRWSPIPA